MRGWGILHRKQRSRRSPGLLFKSQKLTQKRITSLAYVYSAALPAILAVTASESISLLASKEGEEQLTLLIDNAKTLRSILDKSEFVETMSDYNSPISHYRLNDMAISVCGLTTLQDQERLLQDIVDEVCSRSEASTDSR